MCFPGTSAQSDPSGVLAGPVQFHISSPNCNTSFLDRIERQPAVTGSPSASCPHPVRILSASCPHPVRILSALCPGLVHPVVPALSTRLHGSTRGGLRQALPIALPQRYRPVTRDVTGNVSRRVTAASPVRLCRRLHARLQPAWLRLIIKRWAEFAKPLL